MGFSEIVRQMCVWYTASQKRCSLYWSVSNLRMVGYDGVLSIEHEDSLMSANEGLMKAVTMLKQVLLTEELGDIWWA